MEPILVSSAVAVPVWKTIAVGTFANSFALRNALDAAGCGNRNSVEEVLARPAFNPMIDCALRKIFRDIDSACDWVRRRQWEQH
jgi:hypothetical protein